MVNKKTIEFCYFTGEYVGEKHSYCLCNVNKLCKRVIEIPSCLHNGSSYDYHFIIKELAKGVDGLVCVRENSEMYITFKAIINSDDIEFRLKFIDAFRFIFNFKNVKTNVIIMSESIILVNTHVINVKKYYTNLSVI